MEPKYRFHTSRKMYNAGLRVLSHSEWSTDIKTTYSCSLGSLVPITKNRAERSFHVMICVLQVPWSVHKVVNHLARQEKVEIWITKVAPSNSITSSTTKTLFTEERDVAEFNVYQILGRYVWNNIYTNGSKSWPIPIQMADSDQNRPCPIGVERVRNESMLKFVNRSSMRLI